MSTTDVAEAPMPSLLPPEISALANPTVPQSTTYTFPGFYPALLFVPPTADPHIVGAVWNNAGVLAISAG
jgi:hypothetical protein